MCIVGEEYSVNAGLVPTIPDQLGKIRIQYHRSATRTQHPSHFDKGTGCLWNIGDALRGGHSITGAVRQIESSHIPHSNFDRW